ncbi:VOC family protein [Amycolatopsis sp. NPDC088138]|uniref:VOC family protein n=1 Tax=Amycolatopsis sp. NPDC088138 TaxID=3363938 RepID=UPI00381BB4BF
MAGAPDWFEIISTDPWASRRFHREVFDWAFPVVIGAPGYERISPHDSAGVMGALRADRHRDALALSVPCEDVTASAERAEELGADVLRPVAETPGGGADAMVADVLGNPLTLRERPQGTLEPAPSSTNVMRFFEIGSTDVAATEEFYGGLFGWRFDDGITAEGVRCGRLCESPVDYTSPVLAVEDVDSVLDAVRDHGGDAESAGAGRGGFRDPRGHLWGVAAA